MKKIFTIFFCAFCIVSIAQDENKNKPIRECGTLPPPREKMYIITPDMLQKAITQPPATPYVINVFFHKCANDDGTNVACGDSSIMRQLDNARIFYAPQNICFLLAGIDQINSTDLNTQDASNEESELNPYMVSGCLNVFVHSTLFDNNGGLNGIAYAIPNTYLSIVSSAIKSASNRSTLAHEMGHDFNLLHTFETYYGAENVARSGSCMDCDVDGDLLCDTKADPNSSSYDVSDYITNCVYSGPAKDACGAAYQMDPHNLMTYGVRSCRDIFTNGQGGRTRSTIANNTIFADKQPPASYTVTVSVSQSSGKRIYVTKTDLTVNSSNFHLYGSCDGHLVSKSVNLLPGVDLAPTGNGVSEVRINTFCQ